MNSEWSKTTMGDICESIFDGPHATPKKTESGPVYLGISNLVGGRLNLTNTEHLSEEDYVTWTRRVEPRANDIVFSYETRLGEAAIIPEGLRCCLGRRLALLRADLKKVDPKFLLYSYVGPEFQEIIRSRTIHGSTVDRIPLIQFGSFPIRIPPLGEQKAIAKILSSLDDKIELNRRMNATLEAMARALFKSWFVDFEPVHANKENRPSTSASPEIAKLFPSAFENGIPRGWQLRKLGDQVSVVKGRSYTSKELSESGNALVTLKSFIRGGGYKSNGLKPYTGTFKPEQRIEDGEIIVACTDVTQAAEVIGRAALFQSNHEFENHVASLDVQIVRPKEPGSSLFYYHLMRSDDYVSHVLSYTSGTTVLHLAKDAIQCYEGIHPGKELVRLYSDLINPFFERIRLNQNEGASLSNLRDSLLPRLISGRIRIA